MNDQTTIILQTKNHYKHIISSITRLIRYINKYHNIEQIIICDQNSTDGTKDYLSKIKEPRICIIEADKNIKKSLIKCLQLSTTNNTILLEPELYTRLHQIQRQIKRLRKTNLVYMNRFDKKSKTKFANNRIFAKTKINNEIIRDLTRTKIRDVTNINKAFKKEIILPLLETTETDEYYWLEIATMHQHWMQYKTHYTQERTCEKSNSLKTLKELSIIKKKQEEKK